MASGPGLEPAGLGREICETIIHVDVLEGVVDVEGGRLAILVGLRLSRANVGVVHNIVVAFAGRHCEAGDIVVRVEVRILRIVVGVERCRQRCVPRVTSEVSSVEHVEINSLIGDDAIVHSSGCGARSTERSPVVVSLSDHRVGAIVLSAVHVPRHCRARLTSRIGILVGRTGLSLGAAALRCAHRPSVLVEVPWGERAVLGTIVIISILAGLRTTTPVPIVAGVRRTRNIPHIPRAQIVASNAAGATVVLVRATGSPVTIIRWRLVLVVHSGTSVAHLRYHNAGKEGN